ncbi:MAG: aldo/keto reductase [Cyanobacteria bacterium Co-bin13]|nr:aldo/keto reductase [Cyanobacteria bacterium Co-bin13]
MNTATGKIPMLGLGTYQLSGDTAVEMVKQALKVGYRHIDTAQAYDNEAEVGHAILSSGLPRAHVFVTTKVWPERFSARELPKSVDESLNHLNFEYVDLLLLHWPNPEVPLAETLEALMAVQQAGKTRYIGVSNFTTDLMRQAVEICGPGVLINNQVEYHPYLNQDRVIKVAKSLDLTITAYRPVAKGRVFADDTINRIAQAHQKTAAQVTLRWLIQQGVIVIPRSSQPEHISENFHVFGFQLSDDEMAAISSLRGNQRLVSPAGLAPTWDQPEASLTH